MWLLMFCSSCFLFFLFVWVFFGGGGRGGVLPTFLYFQFLSFPVFSWLPGSTTSCAFWANELPMNAVLPVFNAFLVLPVLRGRDPGICYSVSLLSRISDPAASET